MMSDITRHQHTLGVRGLMSNVLGNYQGISSDLDTVISLTMYDSWPLEFLRLTNGLPLMQAKRLLPHLQHAY